MQNEQELNELFPSHAQYREELLELFQGDTTAELLREILSDYHSNDIASIFPLLTAEQRASVYNALEASALSDIFSYLKDADLYTVELEASQLADIIDVMFANSTPCDGSVLTNPRQFDAIRRAYEGLLNALQGLKLGLSPDAVLTDVEIAMYAIGEVMGNTVREDITARIFERFCVGK